MNKKIQKIPVFLKKNIKKISLGLLLIIFVLLSSLILYTAINDISNHNKNLVSFEKSCITGKFILPKAYAIEAPFEFEYTFEGSNYLFKNTLCVKPTELLEEDTEFNIYISFLGKTNLKIFEKNLIFQSEKYPTIKNIENEKEFLVDDSILIELDKNHKIFNYSLILDDKMSECNQKELLLECDFATLNLAQGHEYDVELVSKHNGDLIQILEIVKIKTLEPLLVLNSNIKDNSTIYSQKPLIEIDFNKDIDSNMEILFKDEKGSEIDFELEYLEKNITLKPKTNLTLNQKYELVIQKAEGNDGSYLEEAFFLNFNVSTAPVVNRWYDYPSEILPAKRSGDDLLVLVNKKYKLPETYSPKDLVNLNQSGIPTTSEMYARSIIINDLSELGKAAKADGIELEIISGYRSYSTQIGTYQYWVNHNNGNVGLADQVSARPGHSEHQLGTTVDFGTNNANFGSFNNTPAARWLENNAYKYGFAISYPKGAEQITGFIYEGWHYRYIGKENAKGHKESGLVLSQWLGRQ